MDAKTPFFDWNNARAFLATAEEGSLSAAARLLGLTQPTVGRQVAALEKELNVYLFDRVGKQLILTPSGLELVEHVRQMSQSATKVSMAASGQSEELDGEVCITATEAISVFLLPPMLAKIRERYPGISLDVLATDKQSDLTRREADIAIRNTETTQPDLVVRKICDLSARLYAAPSYLERLEHPVTQDCLNRAEFTSFTRHSPQIDGYGRLGLSLNTKNFPIVSENLLVQWELTKMGVALGLMMEVVGDKEPLVQRVQADSEKLEFPIWLVAHPQVKNSKRVRVVYDLLAESFTEFAQ